MGYLPYQLAQDFWTINSSRSHLKIDGWMIWMTTNFPLGFRPTYFRREMLVSGRVVCCFFPPKFWTIYRWPNVQRFGWKLYNDLEPDGLAQLSFLFYEKQVHLLVFGYRIAALCLEGGPLAVDDYLAGPLSHLLRNIWIFCLETLCIWSI